MDARDFFRVKNEELFEILLLQNALEDTKIDKKEIVEKLGEKSFALAFAMTEERKKNIPKEEIRMETKKSKGNRNLDEILDRIGGIANSECLFMKLSDFSDKEEREGIKKGG